MEMDSKYHVGDKVRIVASDISPEELGLIGTKQEIRSVKWCEVCERYEYRINEEPLLWCDEDFEFDMQTELPEFDASGANVLDLFS